MALGLKWRVGKTVVGGHNRWERDSEDERLRKGFFVLILHASMIFGRVVF